MDPVHGPGVHVLYFPIRTRGHEVKHVCEILNIFVLLDKFFCLIVNENTLLLNFLSRFFHLVAFIWEF